MFQCLRLCWLSFSSFKSFSLPLRVYLAAASLHCNFISSTPFPFWCITYVPVSFSLLLMSLSVSVLSCTCLLLLITITVSDFFSVSLFLFILPLALSIVLCLFSVFPSFFLHKLMKMCLTSVPLPKLSPSMPPVSCLLYSLSLSLLYVLSSLLYFLSASRRVQQCQGIAVFLVVPYSLRLLPCPKLPGSPCHFVFLAWPESLCQDPWCVTVPGAALSGESRPVWYVWGGRN